MCRRQIRLNPSVAEEKQPQIGLAGSAHTCMLSIVLVLFVAGGCYLYSVNQSAVQGYHLRTLEKEISRLEQDNAELKISEADMRSLYRIEGSEEALRMHPLESAIYLEEREPAAPLASSDRDGNPVGPVAFR